MTVPEPYLLPLLAQENNRFVLMSLSSPIDRPKKGLFVFQAVQEIPFRYCLTTSGSQRGQAGTCTNIKWISLMLICLKSFVRG